ncbi:protein kinase [Nocardiopsis sp. NPDC007018]|uniref:serine/threonine protein kinase n=1 Tax=Nocardiopsis sp. NPDC007018 TaxID=3155721 RepID=UPI0033F858A9
MDFSLPALPPNVAPLTDGDPLQVGRYRLIGRLGADGVSTLFAAVSPEDEPVSLRLAGAEWAPADDSGGRVATGRAQGVCAAEARDAGTHEGRPWAAIDHLPGPDLAEHVRTHGRFAGDPLLVLAAGLAEALAATHVTGSVHGDVRPDNLVVTEGGPRLLDFGVTRRVDDAASVQSGTSLGWLAPERYEGSPATHRSDVHGWACLVVFAATGEPPFGASPAGHTPGRVPGQILWEMARRARESRVDLRALPEDLRPLLLRAFSPDQERRPTAEDAYLECLLLLGIDERSTADTWPGQLRGLVARHWPRPDVSWYDRDHWARFARAEERGGRGTPGVPGSADASSGPGALAAAPAPGASDAPAGTSADAHSGGTGPAPGPGADPDPPDEDAWGPEAAAEAYGHTPRPATGFGGGPAPGTRSAGTAGRGGADYLFGPATGGGRGPSEAESAGSLDTDEDTDSRSGVGLWLAVGAVGMVAVLGGGYLLFDTLAASPADTVVAEETTEEPAGPEHEEILEDVVTSLACDDEERLSAQQDHAPWRPFGSGAVSPDTYAALLVPGPEGEPNSDPEVWPFVSPLDHDTVDFGLVTSLVEAFPVMSVCLTGVRDTGEGVEFTAELAYFPDVGSHRVYEEDFLTLTPLDPDRNGGVDKEVVRGGSGSELGVPMTVLAELSPQNPTAEVSVLVPGAPERAGIAYRPSAYSGALLHDPSGHCYDVDGTEEWRDTDRLGSGHFALPGTLPGENDMTLCPADGPRGRGGD